MAAYSLLIKHAAAGGVTLVANYSFTAGGQPASEAEWRGGCDPVDCDLHVITRDVDLRYVVLEVPLFFPSVFMA